jgi:hypothetical protein
MRMLDILTMFHNWVCDKDFIWWPFSFLKPTARESMSFRQTMMMTLCFGSLTFVIFAFYALANNMFSWWTALLTLISCYISFFLWFNLITRPFWNRRAKQLQRQTAAK